MILLVITSPVGLNTCERLFFTTRIINIYLRSNMIQEQFSKLVIFNIIRDIIVDTKTILNTFVTQDK